MNIARRFIFSFYLLMACFLAIAPAFAQRQISYYEPDYTKEYGMYDAKYSILTDAYPTNYLQFFSPFYKEHGITEATKILKGKTETQTYDNDGYLKSIRVTSGSHDLKGIERCSSYFYNKDKTIITVIEMDNHSSSLKIFYYNKSHQVDSIVTNEYKFGHPKTVSRINFKYNVDGNIERTSLAPIKYDTITGIYDKIFGVFPYSFSILPQILNATYAVPKSNFSKRAKRKLTEINNEMFRLCGNQVFQVKRAEYKDAEAYQLFTDSFGVFLIRRKDSTKDLKNLSMRVGYYYFDSSDDIRRVFRYWYNYAFVFSEYGTKNANGLVDYKMRNRIEDRAFNITWHQKKPKWEIKGHKIIFKKLGHEL